MMATSPGGRRRRKPAGASVGLAALDLEDAAPPAFDEALQKMMQAAEKFNPVKIKTDDLARSGGAPEEAE